MSAKNKKKARKEKKHNESESDRMERWTKDTNFNLLKPFNPLLLYILVLLFLILPKFWVVEYPFFG